ncbi:MAG: hypothetical protein HOC74_12315 [Gemmatimonadetes bacterium]|jgi:hypothetical protein|nr:hypothetical protein [Gemmatimonadota bacterium]
MATKETRPMTVVSFRHLTGRTDAAEISWVDAEGKMREDTCYLDLLSSKLAHWEHHPENPRAEREIPELQLLLSAFSGTVPEAA